ncbi:hypothetical protein OZX60_04315 [Streptococcaceae bacterium ESL0687]|nr:hypothetical protein OZX60_04315 [Streptococcaceae bacterium ESL0687]
MQDYKIKFTVDGKVISQEEILEMELSRYHHVFKIFAEKGIPISLDGKQLSQNELFNLTLEKAKIALAQTREKMGKKKTLQVFAHEINQGDFMWEEIAEQAPENAGYQEAYVEVETENISLIQFLMFNQKLMKENNLYLPSTIHPEHYYFDADRKSGRQVIVETFGMYKDPSYLDLRPGNKEDRPAPVNKDVDFVMTGKTFLMNTGEDTKMLGMHQMTADSKGMKVKLGVFLPANAPKEIAEGHKWHLLVEFNNGLHIAAQEKPNFIQKAILGAAIKRMKKK